MNKCPMCGADNRPESTACYNCFNPIEASGTGAAPSAPPAPPQGNPMARPPIGQQPRPMGAPQPPAPQATPGATMLGGGPLGGPFGGDDNDGPVSQVGVPLGGPAKRQPEGPGVPGVPPSPYGTPPARPKYNMRPEQPHRAPASASKVGPILYALFIMSIVFGGGGFLAWKFYFLPNGPVSAVHMFIENAQSEKWNETYDMLSPDSMWIPKYAPQYLYPLNTRSRSFEYGQQYVIVFKSVEGTRATVLVKPGSDELDVFSSDKLPPSLKDGYPFYCVKVGDKWKVDLSQTCAGLFPQFKALEARYKGKK